MIVIGNLLLEFEVILAPNLCKGIVILEKSLFDKLLSPISLTFFFEWTSNPKINLPNVPEFPAFRVKPFL